MEWTREELFKFQSDLGHTGQHDIVTQDD